MAESENGTEEVVAGDVGGFLRSVFAESAAQALPPTFSELLNRLQSTPAKAPRPDTEQLSDKDFKAELAQVIPHLRAFGRSLQRQSRRRRRPGAGNAVEGVGGTASVPGRHEHARLDLHHPA